MAKPLSFLPFPPTCLGIANAPVRSTIHFLLHESLALSSSNAASDKDLLIEYAIGGLVAVAYRYPTILKLEANLLRKATDYLAISSNVALAICHATGGLLTALKANNSKLPSSLPSIRVTYESFYASQGEQVLTGIEAILEVFKEVKYRNLIRSQQDAAAIAVGKDAIAIAEAGVFGTRYSLSQDAKDLAPMHIKYVLSVLSNEGIPVTSNPELAAILTKALTIETDARQGIRMTPICYKQETREQAVNISKAYIALVDWQPSQALYRMKLVAQGKLAMLVDILSEFSGIAASTTSHSPAPSNANYGITHSSPNPSPNTSTSMPLVSFKPVAPAPVATSSPSFAVLQARFFMANKRMPNETEKAELRNQLLATPAPAPVAFDISSVPDAPF